MKTWIVSYADVSFLSSQQRLMTSAARYGIDERRPWGRHMLEQSCLYRLHAEILDKRRGGGYWLWKPYIIKETLKEMSTGDLLIYADAGIDIVKDPSPLIEMGRCHDLVVFAGHYEDSGAPGPNLCGKWTKRDCFVCMDCDEPRYHMGQMVDASVLIARKAPHSLAFIREWLLHCCQPQLLTDAPNVCGLPNLPQFIEHRHDQSILSLLAIREGLELFRHPSEQGNHVKEERYREPGEWTRHPYGSKGIFRNSPYGTLMRHHRGFLGQTDLLVSLHRTLPGGRDQVFDAWTSREVLERWTPLDYQVASAHADVRVGGRYCLHLTEVRPDTSTWRGDWAGTYVDVRPSTRLVYSAPGDTQVCVEFLDKGQATAVTLRHGDFPTERVREEWRRVWSSFLDHLSAALIDGSNLEGRLSCRA